MKIIYCFLKVCLLCFPFISTAQIYFPFPTENATWTERRNFGGIGPGTSFQEGFSYRMNGDTIIDNQSYKIIELQHEWSITSNSMSGSTISLLNFTYTKVGALKEEDKKVYFYNFGVGNDYYDNAFNFLAPDSLTLIYDFNISPGDTLTWKKHIQNDYSIYTSLDSITLQNGEVRKVYNFDTNDFWIEGIGSSQGLLGNFNSVGWTEYISALLCYTENENYIYNNTSILDGCDTEIIVEVEEEEEEIVNVYPSPFNSILHISSNFNEHSTISLNIYSINGSLIKSYTISDQTDLDTTNLPIGFYFIHILDEENNILLEKKIFKF